MLARVIWASYWSKESFRRMHGKANLRAMCCNAFHLNQRFSNVGAEGLNECTVVTNVGIPMKICLLLHILLLSICAFAGAKEPGPDEVQVTFRMCSPELAEERRVFITGNVEALGKWRPDVVEMTLAKDHTWTFQLSVPRGTSIQYKYTLGDWGREGARADGRQMANLKLAASESTTRTDRIDRWTNRNLSDANGRVTGDVRYYRQIKFDGLRLATLPFGFRRPTRPKSLVVTRCSTCTTDRTCSIRKRAHSEWIGRSMKR